MRQLGSKRDALIVDERRRDDNAAKADFQEKLLGKFHAGQIVIRVGR